MAAINLYIPIERIDTEQRIVSGWACSEEVAHDGMVIDHDAAVHAFDDWFVNRANMREMHDPHKAIGRAVSWQPDALQRRIWVSARISRGAEDAWEKCKDGTLRAFSIRGNITKQESRIVTRSDGVRRNVPWVTGLILSELSLVDVPSDPAALVVEVIRSDGSSTAVLDDSPLEPPIFLPVVRDAPIHPAIIGVHTHGHTNAGPKLSSTNPEMPHNHLHEHGANGVPDANHGHDHAGIHALVERTEAMQADRDVPTMDVANTDLTMDVLRGSAASTEHDNTNTAQDEPEKASLRAGSNADSEDDPNATITDKKLKLAQAGGNVNRAAAYTPEPYKADADETIKCPNCGKMNDTDAVYCDQCGAKLAGSTDIVQRTTTAPVVPTATVQRDDAPPVPVSDGGTHGAFSGTHSHKHNDSTTNEPDTLHTHDHTHNDDGTHSHDHSDMQRTQITQTQSVDDAISRTSKMLTDLYDIRRKVSSTIQRDAQDDAQITDAKDVLTRLQALIASEAGETDENDTWGMQSLISAMENVKSFIMGEAMEAGTARRKDTELDSEAYAALTRTLTDISADLAQSRELTAALLARVMPADAAAVSRAADATDAPSSGEIQRQAGVEAPAANVQPDPTIGQLLERIARLEAQPAGNGPLLRTDNVAVNKEFAGGSQETPTSRAEVQRQLLEIVDTSRDSTTKDRASIATVLSMVQDARDEAHAKVGG